jgi:hypothetical protein
MLKVAQRGERWSGGRWETNVAEVIALGKQLAKPLNRRRPISVDLPEFIVRAIEWRVDDANADSSNPEEVTFNDVVEWLLVSEVTPKRIPALEQSIPGFAAAMFEWLMEATYQEEE